MTVFAQILERYGDDAVIHSAVGDMTVRVFIQPMLSKTDVQTWPTMTRLGEADTARYDDVGPSAVLPETGDRIECGGRCYEVIRAERFRAERQDSHVEALLSVWEEEWNGNDL